jgi:hypothetical protein
MAYWTNYMNMMGWGRYAAIFGALLVVAIIICIALYVYFAFAWSTIAKKLNYDKPWLAWIPFANIAMILQLGGFHWAWVFLLLIPVLGWIAIFVLLIISNWKVFEQRKYPGWLSLVMVLEAIPVINWIFGLAYLIIIGLVAWNDMK